MEDSKKDIDYKHCQKCRYYEKQFNLNLWYCHYALREHKLRKRNPVTGECESYDPTPNQKLTKEERIEKSRKSLQRAEVDTAYKRFKE